MPRPGLEERRVVAGGIEPGESPARPRGGWPSPGGRGLRSDRWRRDRRHHARSRDSGTGTARVRLSGGARGAGWPGVRGSWPGRGTFGATGTGVCGFWVEAWRTWNEVCWLEITGLPFWSRMLARRKCEPRASPVSTGRARSPDAGCRSRRSAPSDRTARYPGARPGPKRPRPNRSKPRRPTD